MKRLTLLLPFIVMAGAMSCNSVRDTNLPGISGKSGEIIVLIEKHRWEDTLGSTIRTVLQAEAPNLPQPEPLFSIIQLSPSQFNSVFQPHRNIMIVKLNPDSLQPRISLRRNVWSSPQLVMDLVGPSDTSLSRYILESAPQIVERFNQAEMERLIANARKYQDPDIVDRLKEKYGLSLYIPRGYSLDVDSSDFAWISLETPSTTQGILIYTYPYTSTEQFSPASLISARNRITRAYVPGPLPGSWMTTETLVPPEFSEFMDGNRYFAKLEGLWKLEGRGSMGGPFVSLSTADTERSRVVTVEGFVYAPGEDKRELLRQVEAIVYTLKIEP